MSEDTISREKAYKVLSEYYHHKTEMQHKALREALDRVPSVDIDLSDYSDRLWRNAYERGKTDAEPERKKGRWKIKTVNTFDLAYGSTGYEPVYECSVCGAVEESYLRLDEPIMPEDADFPNFCPNCGADMRGGGE